MDDEQLFQHIRIASERASTNPEVSSAHSLAAIAALLAQANFIHGNY